MDKAEEFPQRSIQYARDQVDAVLTQTEDYVRERPAQSLLYAFIAGFVMNRLPLTRIFAGVFRLGVLALKPAILIYGATKLYQAMEEDR